ncbi:hypothetical protein C1T31_11255 [Hanstruepera neustonica]|uniref:LVIVD repeat-containing protein n=1 Tax=Hanstruepera neustonica TaxID=1445657 RepID=A0A2K1DXG2_9FLAO|nr:hypothetical protein [Hanstruepera neustonica]PNQ72711.1 hypothetical protein C1T31_11255 [Hanstruepera neustonica]
MKQKLFKLFTFSISLILMGCFGYNGNDDDDGPNTIDWPQSAYSPVFMDREEFETTTELLPPQTIVNSGKIYVKDALLFINEVHEGFHIINNANPENPQNIAFLKVIGSSDISIKNNSLYVDNAVDLIALRINDTYDSVEITKRITDIFPNPLAISPDGHQAAYSEGLIVVDWELNE